MSLRTSRDFRGPVQDAKEVIRNLFGGKERERERAGWGSACFYIQLHLYVHICIQTLGISRAKGDP